MSEPATSGWVPDPTSDFGARLALVRQHMAWNVRAAALACHLDPESWRAWEQHGRKPRDYVHVCQTISFVTGCNLPWLMGAAGGEVRAWGYSKPQPSDPKSDESRHQIRLVA